MKGIYFINTRISFDGITLEDSIRTQEEEILRFIRNENIETIKLNPYQVYTQYTILHALFYDLKQSGTVVDYLIIYSKKVVEDFIYSYPARWILLKSYFSGIISIYP
ncbi:hypothetical protein [Bacillus sp. FJAT-27445]|uniref:hypothetical protein n=1 Tax=Bacillus sp. FJAT-27445 TaxID=1679166 RepID=UPI0007438AAF|nr:hypothetical protein [Bacillus sp. FJAT-27445]